MSSVSMEIAMFSTCIVFTGKKQKHCNYIRIYYIYMYATIAIVIRDLSVFVKDGIKTLVLR